MSLMAANIPIEVQKMMIRFFEPFVMGGIAYLCLIIWKSQLATVVTSLLLAVAIVLLLIRYLMLRSKCIGASAIVPINSNERNHDDNNSNSQELMYDIHTTNKLNINSNEEKKTDIDLNDCQVVKVITTVERNMMDNGTKSVLAIQHCEVADTVDKSSSSHPVVVDDNGNNRSSSNSNGSISSHSSDDIEFDMDTLEDIDI